MSEQQQEGLRARKRRQTQQRIVAAALSLFLERGYEATTIDAIADAAEIARRTFFHYFDGKEAIIVALQGDAEDAFRLALAKVPKRWRPLRAIHAALRGMIASYESEQAIAIDRFMRSTELLRALKQASYERNERELLAALRERWPEADDEPGLRAAAMIGIGAIRLASDQWSAEQARRPLEQYLDEQFAAIRRQVSA
ncbi:helix-turn-helix domain-containing protein [Paraburkholderia sp. J41]|uniref:TetR/AcrR family transcriptional regulator n=1 Tax=Paraburkholderia sp. J41 TaxID=2805433 RepID=UPI002AC34C6F|nr:helix-turn-helix domain-containing protein [Paraburkholderia sp. J41]